MADTATTTDNFTDAQGNVILHGQTVPELKVLGWVHHYTCVIGQFFEHGIEQHRCTCECNGYALMGWADR